MYDLQAFLFFGILTCREDELQLLFPNLLVLNVLNISALPDVTNLRNSGFGHYLANDMEMKTF